MVNLRFSAEIFCVINRNKSRENRNKQRNFVSIKESIPQAENDRKFISDNFIRN